MRRVVALVAMLLGALLVGAPVASATPTPRASVVIKVRDLTVDRRRVADALGGSIGRDVADDTFVVDGALSSATPPPGVAWLAPDTTYRAARMPTDVCYIACQAAPDGQKELATMAAALAGGVIAFYQLGYGIAAFGVGPLLDAGVTMPTIYAAAAIVALAMGMASFAVTRAASPVSPLVGAD